MKHAIRKIDEAIKSLYNIEITHKATDFLVRRPLQSSDTREVHGSLYLLPDGDDMSIGIYFHPKVREELSDFRRWNKFNWTPNQRNAFATAAEEVSHFIYFLFHSQQGREISQFELELQGEIDKFLLLYFSESEKSPQEKFESLFDSVFTRFRWAHGLSSEEKGRYEDAHCYAKKFASGLRSKLGDQKGIQEAVEFFRKYYRLSSTEKMSYLHK